MKKQIFILIVLASVAIGSAIPQVSAGTYYTDDGGRYSCDGGDISCVLATGDQCVWDNKDEIGNDDLVVDPDILTDEEFSF